LAVAGNDPNLGRVEVRYNDLPVQNLQFSNVEIENESSRDFTNVEIKLLYLDGTEILGQGQVAGMAQFIPWAGRYSAELEAAAAIPEDQRDRATIVHALLARREYVIPVFNRGIKMILTHVVHAASASPIVQVACDHPGVRLCQRPQRPMIFGVVQAHSILFGMGAAVFATLITASLTRRTWVVALVAFLSSGFGQLWGAAIIRLKRWVVKAIG